MAATSWRQTTLGDFVRLQRGHDLTETDRRHGTVPIMGSAGQNGFHDTARAKGPGVVIGRSGVGSMGVVTYCASDYWPHNTVLYVTDFKGNDERFTYYFLQHLNLRRFDSGSAQASLNRNYIYPLSIRVPGPKEQRAISHFLGTLDDKIELNRRMNETLERMIRLLFKAWFVDAAKDGLPTGWRESSIGEEVRVVGGGTPRTSKTEFWEGAIYFATPRDLAGLTSPVLLETERRITKAGLSQISSGLLPVGTVLLSSRAPIGYLAISEIPVAVNQGFIAMICEKDLPNHFVRPWVTENMETIKANANGTTFLEISKKNFRPLRILVPSKQNLEKYSHIVEPLHRRMVSNLRASRTLAGLRNMLLPRLLSGALRLGTTS